MGAAALAAGTIVGVIIAPPQPPPTLAGSVIGTSVPVEVSAYLDERTVEIVPVESEPVSLTAPRAGTVTSAACTTGTSWTSGTIPLTIDSVPVVALYLAYPPWRDLTPGIEGPDVVALQQTLTALGYPVEADGYMSWETGYQLSEYLAAIGLAPDQTSLYLSDFIWLRTPSVTPTTCSFAPGDKTSAGEEIASLGSIVTAFEVAKGTTSLVAGDRVIQVGAQTAPVDANGQVTDPEGIGRLTSTSEFTTYEAGDKKAGIAASIALASAIDVLSVPPGAIVGGGTSSTCVLSSGRAIEVTVVASSLGRTLVQVTSGAAPRAVDLPAADQRQTCK